MADPRVEAAAHWLHQYLTPTYAFDPGYRSDAVALLGEVDAVDPLRAEDCWIIQAVNENTRYRKALKRIADLPSGGIPGHSVAVGCRHNIVAWKALNAPNEVECGSCDGKGYTVDWGPWQIRGVFGNAVTGCEVTDQHADPNDSQGVMQRRDIPCADCTGDGWIIKEANDASD